MRSLLCVFMLMTLVCCLNLGNLDTEEEQIPASYGKYAIEGVSNEPLLLRQYPESNESGCGLDDDEFIKYATSKIDHTREFQFIVFLPGKPLVGERCFKSALIFYLK